MAQDMSNELEAQARAERALRQGHQDRPQWHEEGRETASADRVAHPHHRRRKRTIWRLLADLIRGVNLPPALVAAARGVLAAGVIVLAEMALTWAHIVPEGSWQAVLPAFVAAVRLLEGVVLDWGKRN